MANLARASKQENVSTSLSTGITDVAGSMDVGDATKLNYPCYLVIDRVDSAGTLKSTSLWEYVKVTNIAGNTLTITRGQGGSTGQSHSAGAVIEAVETATLWEEYYAVLNPEHTTTGAHVMGTATVAYLGVSSTASIQNLYAANSIFANVTISGSINVGTYVGSKGQFVWNQSGACATSLATAVGDTHLPFLRARKNLTIDSVWAGMNSAPSLSFAEITFLYRSTPTSSFNEVLTQHLFVDLGEYTSDSAVTVSTLALTSLASGTLLYPSIMKHGNAGDLLVTMNCTER